MDILQQMEPRQDDSIDRLCLYLCHAGACHPKPSCTADQRGQAKAPLVRTQDATHGGRLAAAPERQLLLRVAHARPGAAVLRAPREPALLLLHGRRHGRRPRALLHALGDRAGAGKRLLLRPAAAGRASVPEDARRQREPDLPPLLGRCARRRRLLDVPPCSGRAERVGIGIASVPLGAEHAGVDELVLQRKEQQQSRREDFVFVVGAVEQGAAEVPADPDAAVQEGEGARAEAQGRAGGNGSHGEPGARRRVVPRQCRHGRPRRHPLLQEVQRKLRGNLKPCCRHMYT